MSDNSEHTRLIEDYVRGNLSEQDRSMLENKIATDPLLKGEVEIQRDIIGVIQNARRTELKSILTNTHVGWYHMVPPAWKAAATITLFTVTAISAYYLINRSREPVKADIAVESVIESQPGTVNTDISTHPKIEDTKAAENTSLPESVKPSPVAKDLSNQDRQKKDNLEIVIPQPDLDDNPGNLENNHLTAVDEREKDALISSAETASKVVTVTTEIDQVHDFHYTFKEGNLMLYGNFDGTPYEILEVNSTNGKRYFLYYNSEYFNLTQNTTSISPLARVTDEKLISELEILKTNK